MRSAKNAPISTFSIQNSASSANTLQPQSRTPATGTRFAASSTQAETGFSTDAALSANQADVGEGEAVGDVAHQRAREVKLRAEAHLLQRGGLELGEQQLAHRLDRGMTPRRLAAADVGHFAEAFAAVHHVEQLLVLDHLGLALGEEEEAAALLLLLHHRLALGDARPFSGARELPDLGVGKRREHRDLLQRHELLAVRD